LKYFSLDQAEFGLTIVTGMKEQGLLKTLMAKVGVTKLTHYGSEFDVKAKQASLPWFELVQVTLGYYCLV
jgi:hypothetical protein